MCADCSSYSQHSGICPECRCDEFIKERTSLQKRLSDNMRSIVLSSIVVVLLIALAIWLIVAVHKLFAAVFVIPLILGIRVAVLLVRRKPMRERVEFLTEEIDKLTVSLGRGNGRI